MKKGETKADRGVKVAWLRAVASEDGVGCRDWPWSKSAKGYGTVYWDGRARRVGHVAMMLAGNARPSPLHHQLHSCDRPACCAPWHLRWGSNAENRADSIERGRFFSKLTEAEVIEIYLAQGEFQRVIAARYGVTQRVVWQIKHGQTWKRVTGHEFEATA